MFKSRFENFYYSFHERNSNEGESLGLNQPFTETQSLVEQKKKIHWVTDESLNPYTPIIYSMIFFNIHFVQLFTLIKLKLRRRKTEEDFINTWWSPSLRLTVKRPSYQPECSRYYKRLNACWFHGTRISMATIATLIENTFEFESTFNKTFSWAM